ncbi:hydroxyisourate hydrolase [Ornithinimicrobium flavum]|uniref:hydroxyisourate hydrolase n=1 Tax=Ornithinimicrobium flavum TaxID=1288636 RepID=UPI00106F846A|nr:hydroxyisourate hydrolase [Ornithinimicrobium flavum]
MTSHRSFVTAHVLDATAGTPAAGVPVALADGGGEVLARAVTDADGRVGELGPERLPSGTYRITFGTGEWFAARGQETFYPQVQVEVRIDEAQAHYHVPLLLSPFAYSTYRGS